MPSVIDTARWATAQRARESGREDRLFSDPLALAEKEGRTALQLSEKYNPRHADTANYISLRTRFCDDIVREVEVSRPEEQGAKYDATRFVRQPGGTWS
ncbi:MAG: hypothetical protein KGS61_22325, partial [Verrucomicrobia bacterium]|nr:hypothetical protein [Verrucomicrobiota bacterium]